jgi:hypothetical protein
LKWRHVHRELLSVLRLFSRGSAAEKGAIGQEVTGTR